MNVSKGHIVVGHCDEVAPPDDGGSAGIFGHVIAVAGDVTKIAVGDRVVFPSYRTVAALLDGRPVRVVPSAAVLVHIPAADAQPEVPC